MGESELKLLLEKYNNNLATDEEKAIVESWYLQYREAGDADYALQERLDDADSIWARLNHGKASKRYISLALRVSAAASIIVSLSCAGYYFLHRQPQAAKPLVKNIIHDIAPGTNKAVLTLANGTKIPISGDKNAVITQQGNIKIVKNNNGRIVYLADHVAGDTTTSLAYNTLSTPRGGQTAVTLADGTVAYLDAGSSIKYPVTFSGTERRVQVTGQVYFEVIHNAAMPFRVEVKGQTIEDIGTAFNIKAYDDDPFIKTTLLRGSVKLTKGKQTVTLKPGEQATSSALTGISVKDVDTEESVAWKNGYFLFDNEGLISIMHKISRWYDVDITYPETKSINEAYWGSITRYSNVSKVLNMLEVTGNVRFKIEGKKIIVLKK